MNQPSHDAAACYNRGNALQDLGRFDEAVISYDQAIALKPGLAAAYNNRGNALQNLKRFDEAIASYDQAIALRPDFASAHNCRGSVLQELGRHGEALASYDRALGLQPNDAAAHYNRGNVLQDLGRYEEAVSSYDRAIALRPDLERAFFNRGNALQNLKRFAEAMVSYDHAIALRPDYAEAFCNRGGALLELRRHEEAIASCDRAIALRPDLASAFSNRGAALLELRRHEEAIASYDRAIAARPDNADAHFNQAVCRLLLGDFERGWEQSEWRWETQQARHSKRRFKQPLWIGKSEIAGKTILLYAEQGFGDAIQFCRYVPLVAERGARVILSIREPLRELMTCLVGKTQIATPGSVLPDFDVHCPLLSLPLAFGTRLETIPSAVPYLRAPSHGVIDWNTRLGPKHRPRIGLAWSGSPTHKNDSNRSIPLASLLSLLDMDATFVSLQKDVKPEDALILSERTDLLHFGDDLQDFSDTAALIANMDLVISIDTSVAHLAGALAKPLWVMLPFTPDWRWLLDRDDSPWYPTARLFRQDSTRSWEGVITRVKAALAGAGDLASRQP